MFDVSIRRRVRLGSVLFAALCGLCAVRPVYAQIQFAGALAVPLPTSPYGVAAGDFNNDSKTDLVFGSFGTSVTQVSLALNNGSGGFAPATAIGTGTNPQTAAVGDFDGDAKLDVVTANYTDNKISFLRGLGNGQFAAPVSYNAGSGPQYVAAGDFNNDAKLDIAVVNYPAASSTVSVLFGNGDGTFQTAKSYGTGTNPRFLAIGDLNGDGFPDIVAANNSTSAKSVSVLLNKGLSDPGAFFGRADYTVGDVARSVAIADFNSDGKLDIAVTNGNSSAAILFGSGGGGFGAFVNVATGSLPAGVTTGDVNGDGKPDLLVANSLSNTVSVLLNRANGTGTFLARADYPVGSSPQNVVLADANGDGKLDFAVTNQGGNSGTVYFNKGDGTFYVAPNLTGFTGSPDAIVSGDFNHDGKRDVITAKYTGSTLSVSFGNGDGTFTTQPAITGLTAPSSLLTRDLNNDGFLDLIVTNQFTPAGPSVGILINKGDGTFKPMVTYPTGFSPQGAASGDFNGDGKPDIAVGNNSSLFATILIGVGDGTFIAAPNSPTLQGFASASAAVDLNNDGKSDLVIGTQTLSGLSVLISSGDGTFAAPTNISIGSRTSPFGIAAGDLNGDGNQDIVVSSYDAGSVTVYFGNGAGGLSEQSTYPVGIQPYAPVLIDLDNDSVLDLVVPNSVGNSVSVFKGAGGGAFAPVAAYGTGNSPRSLTLGDFNGDGRLDIITANYTANSLTVLLGVAPIVSVSGTLTFESISANALPQRVTFEFRPTSGGSFTRTLDIPANGAYSLANIPAQSYAVRIKGDKYLAQVITVNAAGNVTGANSFQRAGDANNDNTVDIGDFGVLVNAYGSDAAIVDSGYNVTADFNGDGLVDIGDFGLLVNEYGRIRR